MGKNLPCSHSRVGGRRLGMRLGNLDKCNPRKKKNSRKQKKNRRRVIHHCHSLQVPWHGQYQTWEHSLPRVVWSDPSDISSHLYNACRTERWVVNAFIFRTQQWLYTTVRWLAWNLPVHFSSLSIQFRDGYFWSSCWICDRHLVAIERLQSCFRRLTCLMVSNE